MSKKVDALIAEHVFGYEVKDNRITWKRNYGGDTGVWQESKQIPNYSTDIAAAFEVISNMPYRCDMMIGRVTCVVSFTCSIKNERHCVDGASSNEVAKAIALCALKAKGVSLPQEDNISDAASTAGVEVPND